jgi:ABC-type microcin C transport system duplicated ATPase subunit YejF
MDQIRSLNFSLVDQGAGVALDIAMIKGFDDEFNTHDWSNINQARALLNQAKQIISTNPTKASLRPIVVGLYDLLPNLDRPITEDDDETVLTN